MRTFFKKIYINLLCFILLLISNTYANDEASFFMLLNNYNIHEQTDLYAELKSGFMLAKNNNVSHKRIKYYENYYSKNPDSLKTILNNASPYLYYILIQVERNLMPTEIALLPAIESSFNPNIKNLSNDYAGLWQFIPSTANQFGLLNNDEYNDRQNIIKSTNAAILHLKYLYLMFKQWDIAIAAYNWGEGNIYNAILKSKQKIGMVTYSKLELREITANYVAKLIAIANIIENPAKYNIVLPKIKNEPYFLLLNASNNFSIDKLSELFAVDQKSFLLLNPQFKDLSYKPHNSEQIAIPINNFDYINNFVYLQQSNLVNDAPKNDNLIDKSVITQNINTDDNHALDSLVDDLINSN